MINRIFPKLINPDWDYWHQLYSKGFGPSIFSSPAWQRLMKDEAGQSWETKFLVCSENPEANIHLPVLVNKNRWGRSQIVTQPIAYYATPIELGDVNQDIVEKILKNACSLFSSRVLISLPPWASFHSQVSKKLTWAGELSFSNRDTYLITLDTTADEYFTKNVNTTSRRYTRKNEKMGLELISNPEPEIIREYFNLYSKVFTGRDWVGEKLSYDFFLKVATELEEGGELIVMQYDGRVVGGGILLYDQQAVHYFQGTVDRDVKGVHPMNSLFMRALQQAESKNLKYINLGGVNESNEGLAKFKSSWGGVPTSASLIGWRSFPIRN